MEGWIKLHRAIQDNPLWRSEPFSRGQAWVDLLLLANHKESFFYKRGNKVTVLRGQVGRSEVELSDRWKWSRTKVRKFLTELQEEQQIEIYKSRVTQVLTIVNYDDWQQKEQQKDSRKTTEEQQKDTYKNDKNDKNDKKDKELLPYEKEFFTICDEYKKITGKSIRVQDTPAKIKRSDKYKIITARLKAGASAEEMIKVIELKNNQWKDDKRQSKYIQFSTLFAASNYEKYLDELDNETPTRSTNHENAPTDPKERFKYFQKVFLTYAPELDRRLVNGQYKKMLYTDRNAEGLVTMLENQQPKLLKLWHNTQ